MTPTTTPTWRTQTPLEMEETLAASIMNLVDSRFKEQARRFLFEYQEVITGQHGQNLAQIEDRLIGNLPEHAALIRRCIDA